MRIYRAGLRLDTARGPPAPAARIAIAAYLSGSDAFERPSPIRGRLCRPERTRPPRVVVAVASGRLTAEPDCDLGQFDRGPRGAPV